MGSEASRRASGRNCYYGAFIYRSIGRRCRPRCRCGAGCDVIRGGDLGQERERERVSCFLLILDSRESRRAEDCNLARLAEFLSIVVLLGGGGGGGGC